MRKMFKYLFFQIKKNNIIEYELAFHRYKLSLIYLIEMISFFLAIGMPGCVHKSGTVSFVLSLVQLKSSVSILVPQSFVLNLMQLNVCVWSGLDLTTSHAFVWSNHFVGTNGLDLVVCVWNCALIFGDRIELIQCVQYTATGQPHVGCNSWISSSPIMWVCRIASCPQLLIEVFKFYVIPHYLS